MEARQPSHVAGRWFANCCHQNRVESPWGTRRSWRISTLDLARQNQNPSQDPQHGPSESATQNRAAVVRGERKKCLGPKAPNHAHHSVQLRRVLLVQNPQERNMREQFFLWLCRRKRLVLPSRARDVSTSA